MTTSYARVAILLVLLSPVSTTFAQDVQPVAAASVPPVVRLEGVFVPADGVPAGAVETVTVGLYADDQGGAPLWEETQDARVDVSGRYALFFGATAERGLPLGLFGAEPRWLDVRFARGGPQPRVLLGSVPYALRAASADTLGGLPASAFQRTETSTTGETSAKEAAVPAGRGSDGPRVNTGTANYLGRFTNSIDLTSSVLYEDAGKIGLSTTTPLDFLHSRFTNINGTQTGIAVQNLGNTATSYSGMLFYDQNGALGQFQGFNNATHEYRINNVASGGSINFMLGSTSRFLVRSDGDIDISGSLRKGGVLFAHTRGANSVALGLEAMAGAFPGSGGVAVGHQALRALNDFAFGNVAVGYRAVASNVSSSYNVGVGAQALENAVGANNLALGYLAGAGKVTGDRNVYVGFSVGYGAANTESDTIRIGDSGYYSRFFVGAVRGTTLVAGSPVGVMIDSSGQLGIASSSRRYKDEIEDMGEASSDLMKLRPVTFRYKRGLDGAQTPLEYGLVAEEVEAIYPGLVTRLANGDLETVQYHKVNAMLLNEVQKHMRELRTQRAEIEAQQQQIGELLSRLAALERQSTTATEPRRRR